FSFCSFSCARAGRSIETISNAEINILFMALNSLLFNAGTSEGAEKLHSGGCFVHRFREREQGRAESDSHGLTAFIADTVEFHIPSEYVVDACDTAVCYHIAVNFFLFSGHGACQEGNAAEHPVLLFLQSHVGLNIPDIDRDDGRY